MDDPPIQTDQQRLSELVNRLKQGLDLKLQKPLQPDAQKRLRQA
jgi:hypothetical protein